MKKALITGITGQDGSYLTEFLLSKGYLVHGIIRRASTINTARIDHLYQDMRDPSTRMFLHYGDMQDGASLRKIVAQVSPDEVYNLAAQSHVRVSFDQPDYTADIVATGTLRLLEAVAEHNRVREKPIRFYQAGSSEMFGSARPPQSITTPFHPRSPYAAAKVAAHYYVINYRESYDLFACNGILFNHESPRRGETFVTRKITRAATRIKLGLQKELFLGNTQARRDWGFAGEYVQAMWLMLQQEQPGDYVVATGHSYSVQDFLEKSFSTLDMDWKEFVRYDQRYERPAEVDHLLGDPGPTETQLGWRPQVNLDQLVSMMVTSDLKLASDEQKLRD